jgi:hypothetical protein
MAGFCWIWIPNFGVIAKLLYEATKEPDNEPLKQTAETNHAYKMLKKPSLRPLLGIPNLARPFILYMLERKELLWESKPKNLGQKHIQWTTSQRNWKGQL